MNGSLAITSVKGPDGKTALQFIQDKVNEFNVKINLGQLYPAGSSITLTIDYAGPLATPEGGPIADTRWLTSALKALICSMLRAGFRFTDMQPIVRPPT